jgi:hypothetical protein
MSACEEQSNHMHRQHRRDSSGVNVFCAVSRDKVHGPFVFTESAVTGDSFLVMLENWLLPQLNIKYNDYILQLDRATRMCSASQSCSYSGLNPTCCKWRQQPYWPPCSPDLTQCNFFFWGFVKYSFHVPPLPTSIQELAYTADHYSGQATRSLWWVWLPFGCVSCDPRCIHWRVEINAWETWTVPAADSVCCACVGWEINF